MQPFCYIYFYFLAGLPGIVSTLRTTASIALALPYIAESYGTRSGLAFHIGDTWPWRRYPVMYEGVGTRAVLGLPLSTGLDRLERRFCACVAAGSA